MKYLSIDPSVANRAGWATYDTETKEWAWGAWQIEGFNYQMRCHDLKDYIGMEIGDFDELVCEWPMFYGGDSGAVAAQQGYTINLAGIAMFIIGWFQIHYTKCHLYTAPDWKGSVPKQVTQRRFYQAFDLKVKDVDHNAVDATMMLVYHLKQI